MINKIEFHSSQEIQQSDFQSLIDISVFIHNSKSISSLINSLKLCSKLIALELNLNNCIIEAKQSEKLGLALKNIENIQLLTFCFCFSEFDDSSFFALSKQLLPKKNLKSLKLQLSNTQISNQSISYLISILHELSDLKDLELNISNTLVRELDISSLVQGILNLGLQSFNLKTELTQIIGGLGNIFEQGIAYPVFTTLVKLKLEFEQILFAEKTFENICSFIKLAKNIKDIYINLNNSQIDSQELSCLGYSLSELQNLEQLSLLLNKNKFKEQDFSKLCLVLGKCLCLKSLNISLIENQISVQGEMYIIDQLRNTLNLNVLFLNIRDCLADEDQSLSFLLRNHLRKIKNLVKLSYNFY
ncbi:hypothetical protein ABPG74_008173 [Tetrahymena malaccensis]